MGERRPEQKLFVPIAVMVTIAVTARLGFPLLIALLILPLIAVWIEDSAGIFAAAAVCATAGVAGGMTWRGFRCVRKTGRSCFRW